METINRRQDDLSEELGLALNISKTMGGENMTPDIAKSEENNMGELRPNPQTA